MNKKGGYRLLIIDDEPIITDGLYELLSEQGELELQLEKVYTVQKALELFKRRVSVK